MHDGQIQGALVVQYVCSSCDNAFCPSEGPLECRQEWQKELVLNQRKGKCTACALTCLILIYWKVKRSIVAIFV